ncbi:actin-associated protein [Ceratobasidium sp. AG-Ba]|nr:actin-associated protein [Ceratobasidium sp. AG-Ba]QRW05041.1 actin-associated protein [Ceratobasidium sp. AG-Ba]
MATPAPTVAPTAVPTASTRPIITTRSSTSRRHRTTTLAPTSTVTPYDASSDRRADTQRTNKILIGIFSTLGVVFLGLIAFQLFRCYKRRKKVNSVPLPPPRKSSMSQVGYRNSRMVSMYGDYPTPDFSRPPSVLVRKDQSFGSRSAFVVTPSIHSNAASTDMLGPEEAAKKSAEVALHPGHAARESSSDNSISGPAMAPNDEEAGRRLSPLGSRSQSPSNVSSPRPASQMYTPARPESRTRHPRPNSVASTSRHSYLGAGSWHHGSQRHSTYNPNRSSYYLSGNYGAPHSPHVRDRVGLVMPQPLAPELFNYALVGRHDMGLDFMNGTWGSQGNLAHRDSNQSLAAPRRARTDSWVTRGQHSTPSDSPSTSAAPLPPSKDGSLPRGRASRPEIPRP